MIGLVLRKEFAPHFDVGKRLASRDIVRNNDAVNAARVRGEQSAKSGVACETAEFREFLQKTESIEKPTGGVPKLCANNKIIDKASSSIFRLIFFCTRASKKFRKQKDSLNAHVNANGGHIGSGIVHVVPAVWRSFPKKKEMDCARFFRHTTQRTKNKTHINRSRKAVLPVAESPKTTVLKQMSGTRAARLTGRKEVILYVVGLFIVLNLC